MKQRLTEETAAAVRAGRPARIFNLGCGPAREIQEFLSQSELSNYAQFTLVDFNEETLQHAAEALQQRKRYHQRTTSINLVKKSVQQLFKSAARADTLPSQDKYDFVYCAGLFDYLPDRTCTQLLAILYRFLRPGGLLVVTNITPLSPNQGSLEIILDWHLIYRDATQLRHLCADLSVEEVRIQSDKTGVNLFLEIRKMNDDQQPDIQTT